MLKNNICSIRTKLNRKGGIITKRDIKLLNDAVIYREDKEKR